MRINSYKLLMDSEDKTPKLVKDNSCDCEVQDLSSPYNVAKMLNDVYFLGDQAEEFLYLICLNTKNKALGVFEVSHGTATQTLCSNREIFTRALLCGATYIIMAHNHPSGDPMPSKDDEKVYESLRKAGKLIGVGVLDSLIIGSQAFYSFTAQGKQIM